MRKFTSDQLKSSTRLSRLEDEILQICKKASRPKHYSEIKKRFPRRASLETTLGLIHASNNINVYQDEYAYSGIYADISYTINGGDVYRIQIGGRSANPVGGTVSGAWMTNDYKFELDINQDGHGTWTFSTTSIITSDGRSRSSEDVTSANPDFFKEIPTY